MQPFPPDHVLVCDGGLATELEAAGHDLSDDLWSARLLADDPDAIRAVHRAYLDAGADIVTTASYQASFDGFARHGIDHADAEGLLTRSVQLARDACAAIGSSALVAASVGPYGAALADGSEYRGRYGLTVEELVRWHRPRVEALAAAAPDLLALETVPDVDEAEALLTIVSAGDVPAWLSYTIAADRTRAGQPLADAFAVAADAPVVVAVGVNCCDPRDVLAAVSRANEVTGKPVIVYPNSGEGWDAVRREWIGSPRSVPTYVSEWVEAGARAVGGCCRVGPAEIAAVVAAVRGG